MQGMGRSGAQYGSSEVLLFDPTPGHRATTRAALGMVGFKRITATSDVDEAVQCLTQRAFDVLIADLTGCEQRVCKLVRDVRHGDRGPNPFVVVLLTAWSLREAEAEMTLNSGADDVLIRPYSVTFLAERVRALVESRKSFVVTNGYIGPDRRKAGERSGGDVTLLEAPNTLRAKARPAERGAPDVMELVREAHSKLGDLRLKMTTLQMRLLTHFALRAAADGGAIDNYLAPMSAVAEVLADRLTASADNEAAASAVLLAKTVGSLGRGEGVMESLANLSEYASTLHAQMNADRSMSEREEEFMRAVKRLSTREASFGRQSAAE